MSDAMPGRVLEPQTFATRNFATRNFATAQSAILSLVLVFLTLSAAAQSAAATGGVALILNAKGSVEAQAAGSSSWRPAAVGASLQAGDSLRTGDDSSAILILRNDERIRVMPNASVSLRKETGKPSGAAGALWQSLLAKFGQARDISAAKGTVGTTRQSASVLLDAELDEAARSDLEEAIAALLPDAAGGNADDESSLHLMAAVLYEGAGQLAHAEAEYLAAIEANPREGRLYDVLGALYANAKASDKFFELKERKARALATR